MIHYSTVVSIRCPPGDVLAALLDAGRYSQWTEMTDARFDGSGTPTVGSTGAFAFAGGPLKGRYVMEVTRLDPDRRLDMRIEGPALHWESRVDLEPEDDGTRMTYAGDISLLGWRRLLEPLFAGEARAGEAKEAERFKAMLESTADPVASPSVG